MGGRWSSQLPIPVLRFPCPRVSQGPVCLCLFLRAWRPQAFLRTGISAGLLTSSKLRLAPHSAAQAASPHSAVYEKRDQRPSTSAGQVKRFWQPAAATGWQRKIEGSLKGRPTRIGNLAAQGYDPKSPFRSRGAPKGSRPHPYQLPVPRDSVRIKPRVEKTTRW